MTKLLSVLLAASFTFCIGGAYADDMKKEDMAKDSMSKDSMSKDSMSKDSMSKDGMKKEGMKHDKMMKKDDMAKDGMKKDDMKHTIAVAIGDLVLINEGPFKDHEGTVAEVDADRGKVKVLVSMFGRETPFELDFNQVRKM